MRSHLRWRIRIFLLAITTAAFSLQATAAADDSLDGFWQSDGYGLFLEINADRLQVYQTTSISCVPSWTAQRQTSPDAEVQAAFIMDAHPDLRVLVTAGATRDTKDFRIPESAASTVGFRRVDSLPAACSERVENTPTMNFDIFWVTFAEQYPFFERRRVDWNEVREKFRSRVTEATTRQELFAIFRNMLEPLHDGHVHLQAQGLPGFNSRRVDPHRLSDKDFARANEIIESKYVPRGLTWRCNDRFGFGMAADSIAYLQINGFGVLSKDRNFVHGKEALEEALDAIFEDSARWRGLIIDIRVNRGGSDVYGLVAASRLATKEYLAYVKRARNDPNDEKGLTPPQENRITVSSRPHFGGMVVLLTSRYTVSAGETFAMALMGRVPPIIRVGENTQGIFSDILWRDLPNGFSVGLPNEVYFSEQDAVFESEGIPSDVLVEVFSASDLQNGEDAGIEKAVGLINASYKANP